MTATAIAERWSGDLFHPTVRQDAEPVGFMVSLERILRYMPLPNFLGIGAGRCGTTWVHQVLRAHPEVYVPVTKEVRFFDRNYTKGIVWYEQFFKAAGEAKAIGEFSPQYVQSAEIAVRIKQTLPGVKLIVSLRDPVARAYSEFWWSRADQVTDLSPIVADELEWELQSRPHCVENSFYAKQLTPYFELFGSDQIHVILYDDIITDPVRVARELFMFLDVNPSFLPSNANRQVNPATQYRSLPLLRGMRRVVRRLEKVGLERMVIWAKQIGVRDMVRRFLERPVEYPPIPEDVRQRLQATFAEDITKLEKLLNRDLSYWRGPTASEVERLQ